MIEKRPAHWPLFASCLAVVLGQITYGLVVAYRIESPGIFGDMFGGLNALYSGLGAVVLIYTIWLQSADASESRREQAKALHLVEQQVSFLRQDVQMKDRRDRVEAGPFFKLASNFRQNNELDLRLVNTGAPIIVLDFTCNTANCRVKGWSPSTLPREEEFKAPTGIPAPYPDRYEFAMTIRDRWGDVRYFDIRLDLGSGGARLDFWDRAHPGQLAIVSEPFGAPTTFASAESRSFPSPAAPETGSPA